MCGRYILQMQSLQRFNIAPTQEVPIVRWHHDNRETALVRWGLVPFFARGISPKFSTINARIETLETSPSYRGPWERGQRCLQLASGFYEWHLNEAGRRVPYLVTLADQNVFALAALWERSFKADSTRLDSCAHITMPGNALMHELHNSGKHPHRMPAILTREDQETWLHGSLQDARAVLKEYQADLMVAYEVGPAVNTPGNDGPELIRPVHAEP